MADDIAAYVLTVGIVAITLGLLPLIVMVRRFLRRFHVWIDFDMGHRAERKLKKPNSMGIIHHRKGIYLTRGIVTDKGEDIPVPANAFTLYKGKPMYRFRQGDPRPLVLTMKKEFSSNPGHVRYVANVEPAVVPAEALKIYMDQNDFANIYKPRVGLLLFLALLIIIMIVVVMGLYFK